MEEKMFLINGGENDVFGQWQKKKVFGQWEQEILFLNNERKNVVFRQTNEKFL